MSTTAQIIANRNNSQKSTGPQTVEGKAVASKNAVKHGLFAAEAVVTGENPADYEAYHDQFLAELAPVGMVESMLAERIVSLGWRLQRAERMQNQSIDRMIEREVTDPLAKHIQKLYCESEGIPLDDPRRSEGHLPLGRISMHDWSNCRVLDRLFMYERRIENSLHKTLNKLKTYQMMRVIQQADARKAKPAQAIPSTALRTGPKACGFEAATHSMQTCPSQGDEAATRHMPAVKKGDLKKQSQFAPGRMDVTSLTQGDYSNNPAGGVEENKANQSQSHEPALTKGAGKRKKSLAAANSLNG